MDTKNATIFFVLAVIFYGGFVFAQEFISEDELAPFPAEAFPANEFYLAKILEISERENFEYGVGYIVQTIRVKISSGEIKGEELEIERGIALQTSAYDELKEGDTVVVAKAEAFGQTDYYIADKYRFPSLAIILAIFFGLVVFFGRLRGFTSIIGLALTILILAKFIVPGILSGGDPLAFGVGGAFAIAVLSLYTAHGFNKRTSIALLATLITLGVSAFLAIIFVSFAKLSGGGSEEAFFLKIGALDALNLRGLLLAGIIIGALGVLDDITTTQSAAVDEIKKADPSLGFGELYKRGTSVGKEHIASLVNTLVLAYAGASLPLFLLFSIGETPLWVTLNSEFIAEEVIRTLVGSAALVLAVPVSTALAAYFFTRNSRKIKA